MIRVTVTIETDDQLVKVTRRWDRTDDPTFPLAQCIMTVADTFSSYPKLDSLARVAAAEARASWSS